MEQLKIELRKERDIGQVINTSFSFIAQEIKPLAKILGILVLPVFLVVSILTIYIQYESRINIVPGDYSYYLSWEYWSGLLIVLLLQLIAHTLLIGTIYCYIKLYLVKGPGNFSPNEVIKEVRDWFWRILGTNIAIAFIIIACFILLIIPGIYVTIPLGFITAIMIFENRSMSDAFGRCFKLIKGNWWWTFLLILVLGLIIFSISFIIGIPLMIFGITKTLHTYKSSGSMNPSEAMSTIVLIFSAVQAIIIYMSYVIIYTAYSFQYFNMVEQKERPSLSKKIDQIK